MSLGDWLNSLPPLVAAAIGGAAPLVLVWAVVAVLALFGRRR